MADEEEFGELAEINLSQYGGRWGSSSATGTWGRSPGGGGSGPSGMATSAISSPQHHYITNSSSRFSVSPHQQANHRSSSYEAEDAVGQYSRNNGVQPNSRGRPGLYYSPPGTSYTIVERPTNTPHHPASSGKHPRGTYLGSSTTVLNTRNLSSPSSKTNGKKRPISPEQVLRLFGTPGAHGQHHNRPQRSAMSSPANSPSASQQHHYSHEMHPNLHHDLLVRTVNMVRPPDSPHGFGICVKGGKDSGACSPMADDNNKTGVGVVYISRVEEGSIAERVGLRPGDTILEVNGTPFSGISHEEALKMLKSCKTLSMTVKSPNLSLPAPPQTSDRIQGSSMGSWIFRQTYSWMDRQGRPASPPPEYARASPPVVVATPPPPPVPRYYNRINKDKIRKVELSIEPGQSLGLMIRGGVEYNLGIFITGVDKDSVADRAGLLIGDQILEVNGQSFHEVTHDEAVNHLKFHKRMTLLVRDVGKVPHSCTAYDDIACFDSSTIHSPGRRKAWSPALQMVEEKARIVLSKGEFSTLAYYLEEYAARQMTVEAFVAVLLELLNNSEKYTLLTELREVVLPEDRVKFDELVYRREAEGQRCREFRDMLDQREHDRHGVRSMYYTSARPVKFPMPMEGSFEPYIETEEYHTPSEDSGVGMGPEFSSTRSIRSRMTSSGGEWNSSPCSSHLEKRTSDLALSDFDSPHQDYGTADGNANRGRRHSSPGGSRRASVDQQAYSEDANMPGYLEGLRSHLGGWTQKVKSWYWGRPLELAHKLSRSFDMKEEQEGLEGAESSAIRRHQSVQRLSRGGGGGDTIDQQNEQDLGALIVPDQQGNLRITVKKTKPILGIAIEGGANTKHPLPRIINIHENGAAFEAGGLEVGQLILEVDGQSVEGMHHQDVARLIAESFARKERHDIEFLVIEAKKSNLEPKPTALIFLEA